MSHSETCQFELLSGKKCGHPRYNDAEPYCRFHCYVKGSSRDYKGGGPSAIKQYVREGETYSRVDFSGVRFFGHVFDSDQIPDGTSVDFSYAYLSVCTFKKCKFVNSIFEGCQFEDSGFETCNFGGERCSFESAQFDTKEPPFQLCRFEMTLPCPNFHTEVSFSSASAVVGRRDFFWKCYCKAICFTAADFVIAGRAHAPKFEILVCKCEPGKELRSPVLTLDGVSEIDISHLSLRGSFLLSQWLLGTSEYEPQISIIDVNFDLMQSARFVGVDLRKADFYRASIQRAKFENCHWASDGSYKVLYTSNHLPKASDDLKRLYVQLKKNFESDNNFIEAGDWFFREMEVRRLQELGDSKGLRRLAKSVSGLISWYRLISDYGECYTRPLKGIVLLWVIFAFLYLFAGFSINGALRDYDLCLCLPSWEYFSDLIAALQFSAVAMLFQVGRIGKLETGLGVTVYVIQLLLTTILVSLFLLALRRKFRR